MRPAAEAMTASLGTGKGTCDLDDWEKADLLMVMGVNAASNAPRMLTGLAEAHRRGAQIVHINPLIEAAGRRTVVPHEFLAMATFHPTKTGDMNVQPRVGGDLALLRGVAKVVLECAQTDPKAIDHEFLQRCTTGFEDYRSLVEQTGWPQIVHQSGVDEKTIRKLADVYLGADRTVVAWCLGLTQQEHGVDTVREIVNLLLLRGNIGREGFQPSRTAAAGLPDPAAGPRAGLPHRVRASGVLSGTDAPMWCRRRDG
jgi:anaerobic selenocysteine-containing dehydrogenase